MDVHQMVRFGEVYEEIHPVEASVERATVAASMQETLEDIVAVWFVFGDLILISTRREVFEGRLAAAGRVSKDVPPFVQPTN
jgi:hypothetical protein